MVELDEGADDDRAISGSLSSSSRYSLLALAFQNFAMAVCPCLSRRPTSWAGSVASCLAVLSIPQGARAGK